MRNWCDHLLLFCKLSTCGRENPAVLRAVGRPGGEWDAVTVPITAPQWERIRRRSLHPSACVVPWAPNPPTSCPQTYHMAKGFVPIAAVASGC